MCIEISIEKNVFGWEWESGCINVGCVNLGVLNNLDNIIHKMFSAR